MNLERIIEIINNEEYVDIKIDSAIGLSHWYDIRTINGGDIRIECLTPLFKKDIYRIYLFTPENEKAVCWWEFNHKSEDYNTVEDLYYKIVNIKKSEYSKYF